MQLHSTRGINNSTGNLTGLASESLDEEKKIEEKKTE